MISKNTPPKLAILRNYNTPEKWGQEMLQSWLILIKTFAPDAEIQVFCPVTGDGLPNPDEFDVIILTGGLSDLTIPKPDPWVQDVFDLIEDVAKNHPNTKVLGVCWGHQAIAKALGGSIASNKSAERVGVHTVRCTTRGRRFFSTPANSSGPSTLSLHQFHKRHIENPAPGFALLAEENEALVSDSNQILTFQGHPDVTAKIAEEILKGEAGSFTCKLTAGELAKVKSSLDLPHDGLQVFGKIMDWILE